MLGLDRLSGVVAGVAWLVACVVQTPLVAVVSIIDSIREEFT